MLKTDFMAHPLLLYILQSLVLLWGYSKVTIWISYVGRYNGWLDLGGLGVRLLQQNTCTVKLYIPLGVGHTSSYTDRHLKGRCCYVLFKPLVVVVVVVLEYATTVATVILESYWIYTAWVPTSTRFFFQSTWIEGQFDVFFQLHVS